jgi:hypothetical protein
LAHFTPGGWWIGCDQADARPCWGLLRLVLIGPVYGYEGEETVGYRLNEEGRRAAIEEGYEPQIVARIRENRLALLWSLTP